MLAKLKQLPKAPVEQYAESLKQLWHEIYDILLAAGDDLSAAEHALSAAEGQVQDAMDQLRQPLELDERLPAFREIRAERERRLNEAVTRFADLLGAYVGLDG